MVQSQVMTTSGIQYPPPLPVALGHTKGGFLWVATEASRHSARGGGGPGSSPAKVALVVVAGEDRLRTVIRVVGTAGTGPVGAGRVLLEEMAADALPVGRSTVPRAGLRGIPERFLAEEADLRRCDHPGRPPWRGCHDRPSPR